MALQTMQRFRWPLFSCLIRILGLHDVSHVLQRLDLVDALDHGVYDAVLTLWVVKRVVLA